MILLLFNAFAGGQIFDCTFANWQGRLRRLHVADQRETKAGRWSITSIADLERSQEIVSESVAVLVHPPYKKTHLVRRQFCKIALRNCSQGLYKHRVSRDYGAYPSFSDSASLNILRSAKSSVKRMGICNACGFLFALRSQKKWSYRPPRKLSWEMPAILEIDNYFCVLFRIFRNNEVSDNSVFPSNRNIGSVGNSQSNLSNPPLSPRVDYIRDCQSSNNSSCDGLDCGRMFVGKAQEPIPTPSDYMIPGPARQDSNRYEKPRYVLAVFSFLGGIFLLGLAGAFFAESEACASDASSTAFHFIGFVCPCVSLWLIYHCFNLAVFRVYPCPPPLFSCSHFVAFHAHGNYLKTIK